MQPRPTTADNLPAVDPASRAHSQRVTEAIAADIDAAGGSLGFAEFMHRALYAPGLGYYAAGARKFGAGGDFVTAPEVSPLFGRVLAQQVAGVLRGIQGGELLELGAGSGALALQLLEKLAELDCLPARYRILDVSPDLRERQRALLSEGLPDYVANIEWLDTLPIGFEGVIVANEVADALPVERFVKRNGKVMQLRVVNDTDGFAWQEAEPPAWLAERVAGIEEGLGRVLPDGYLSELSPGLPDWIADIAGCLDRGALLLFDYGVSRREYYAADRSGGWLRCHFRHHAHDDPLILAGIQDLTAWVDFTTIAEAAVAAGLDVDGYTTQAQFLLHGGLADEMAAFETLPEAEQYELARQVKLLTLPGEMGEHFKCLGLSRGLDAPPAALLAADQSHRL